MVPENLAYMDNYNMLILQSSTFLKDVEKNVNVNLNVNINVSFDANVS